MTQMENTEHQHYNEVAVRTAEALQVARRAFQEQLGGGDVPREKLFSAFDRAGLGVALEYERMGNRPVSKEL